MFCPVLSVPLEIDDLKTLMERINYAKKHRGMQKLLSGERKGSIEVELIETIIGAFEEYNWVEFETYMRLYLPIVLMPGDILEAVRDDVIALSHCQVVARLTESRPRGKLIADLRDGKLKRAGIGSAVARALGQPPPPPRGGIAQRLRQVESLSRTASFRGESHRRFETARHELARKREEFELALLELETMLESEIKVKSPRPSATPLEVGQTPSMPIDQAPLASS